MDLKHRVNHITNESHFNPVYIYIKPLRLTYLLSNSPSVEEGKGREVERERQSQLLLRTWAESQITPQCTMKAVTPPLGHALCSALTLRVNKHLGLNLIRQTLSLYDAWECLFVSFLACFFISFLYINLHNYTILHCLDYIYM